MIDLIAQFKSGKSVLILALKFFLSIIQLFFRSTSNGLITMFTRYVRNEYHNWREQRSVYFCLRLNPMFLNSEYHRPCEKLLTESSVANQIQMWAPLWRPSGRQAVSPGECACSVLAHGNQLPGVLAVLAPVKCRPRALVFTVTQHSTPAS